jgi:hypothetical protein
MYDYYLSLPCILYPTYPAVSSPSPSVLPLYPESYILSYPSVSLALSLSMYCYHLCLLSYILSDPAVSYPSPYVGISTISIYPLILYQSLSR